MNAKSYSNDSSSVFRVMSSGMRDKFSCDTFNTGPVEQALDLLWIKLAEKYSNTSDAYRYFDVNFNNRVTFNEFQKALGHMRITYKVSQV